MTHRACPDCGASGGHSNHSTTCSRRRRPQASIKRGEHATRELVRTFVAWDYGLGPAAPYVEAAARWRAERSLWTWEALLALHDRRGGECPFGDGVFVGTHGQLVLRAAAGRDARLERPRSRFMARVRHLLPLLREAA